MADVLIVADTIRSPELRHEVPLAVPDPFLYAEVAGKRSVVVSSLESGRIAELGTGLEVLTLEDVGIDELLKRGLDPYAHERELTSTPAGTSASRAPSRPRPSRSAMRTTSARTGSSSRPTRASSTSVGASRPRPSWRASAARAARSRRE